MSVVHDRDTPLKGAPQQLIHPHAEHPLVLYPYKDDQLYAGQNDDYDNPLRHASPSLIDSQNVVSDQKRAFLNQFKPKHITKRGGKSRRRKTKKTKKNKKRTRRFRKYH